VGLGFADDSSADGAWGALKILASGKTLVDWPVVSIGGPDLNSQTVRQDSRNLPIRLQPTSKA